MEGYEMMNKWFDRTSFEGVEVISSEIKDNFPVPTSIGPIPFNYIWDRFDKIGPKTYKVVDYKSNRWPVTVEQLKKKIQPRSYALAAAIQLKAQNIEADRIWVEFDMLRHSPVGIVFTREDNIATYKYILDSAQAIIDTPDDNVEERLNGECLFCVRKASCKALGKNIAVGGIHSIPSIESTIDLRAQLDWQRKGISSLIKDLDEKILIEAKERDMEKFESDSNVLEIGIRRTREVDAERVQHAIGPKLFEKYGSQTITMAIIDKLLKSKELTDQQKIDLRGLVYYKAGQPTVKIDPKNAIDED
jgi:hypothetical protein